jgi:hypothetical protein
LQRKKIQKKACHARASQLDGTFERQMPHFAVQKKLQKNKKKACQRLRNLISLPKPNQTNGETND